MYGSMPGLLCFNPFPLLCYSLSGHCTTWARLGVAPFFYEGERRSEVRPHFQESVRNDCRNKQRAGKANNPPAGRLMSEGLTLTTLLLLPPRAVPVRKTAKAAIHIYIVIRESICVDGTAPALCLHLPFDLP